MSFSTITASKLTQTLSLTSLNFANLHLLNAFVFFVYINRSMTYTACEHPLWADFGGNFDAVNDLKGESDSIRADVMRRAAVARAISSDHAQDRTGSNVDSGVESSTAPPPRAKFDVVGNRWPKLPTESEMPTSTCERLAGMCDLDRTVVITGFGEVGPWGSSRTRWELEAKGKYSKRRSGTRMEHCS